MSYGGGHCQCSCGTFVCLDYLEDYGFEETHKGVLLKVLYCSNCGDPVHSEKVKNNTQLSLL